MCVLLFTSPCGVSESWGGDVPASDSDHSGPRLCLLLLRRLNINPPHPLLLPSALHPGGKLTPSLPTYPTMSAPLPHSIIQPPGRPPSLSHNIKNTFSRTASSDHLRFSHIHQICPPPPHPSRKVYILKTSRFQENWIKKVKGFKLSTTQSLWKILSSISLFHLPHLPYQYLLPIHIFITINAHRFYTCRHFPYLWFQLH